MAKNETSQRKEGGQPLAAQERSRRAMQRWEPSGGFGPFDFIDRMSDEMDRVFDRMFRDFGVPRRPWWRSPGAMTAREGTWTPRVEAFQKGDRFIVRAELPGMKKDDVQVELTEDALTLHGERREEHEEEHEGYYHSEREYGQFYRTIPLPEGVIGESARASFRNGVLEIAMQAAPSEGRKLEIKDSYEAPEARK